MKTILASTAIVVGGAFGAFAQSDVADTPEVDAEGRLILAPGGDGTGLDASPGSETAPVVDGDAENARAAGTIAVDNEGSGLTTQSSVTAETVSPSEPQTQMSDGEAEGSTTNVPSLEDGVVVDNPATPATARVEDGAVETETD